ncbi:hypothetical protein D9619_009015 [Psilocybe cf. subviscida]|uniref:Nephrocystin 3-like N-terminal domain-containing protein n=1 Tax=Psilocybe cf. subviscida TaxID=2480587 RepID=A0A8H5FAA0_9AGAR|nr:hypothetical protein D9619_009015 [Psilocybe cf. subviscida]
MLCTPTEAIQPLRRRRQWYRLHPNPPNIPSSRASSSCFNNSMSSEDRLLSAFANGKPTPENLPKIRKKMLDNNNHPQVSFLENGNNVLVNNSNMTAIGEVTHVRNYYAMDNTPASTVNSDRGLRMLSKVIAHGAMHDSSERSPTPRCDLTTNQPIIDAISAWATDLTASTSVLWVTSPPGAERELLTGIAQTVAEQLVEQGRLGGCFFFDSHTLKRDRETALFSTLAYQIAMNKPEMRGHIGSAMHLDPTFPTKSITIQLRDLITRPFRRMMFSSVINPQVSTIIIDGLEDCGTPTDQLEIVRLILAEVEQKNPIPLRFLILSEPKEYIRDLLEDYTAAKLVLRIDLDIKERVDPQLKYPQFPNHELMCQSMPSATPEVMSLLEAHFSQRPSPPKPMRREAKIRIKGFSPVEVVMNSPKGSTSASSGMQVSGASLTRTGPSRPLLFAGSPMSVDPVLHFSSLRSAMSVDPKSIPSLRGGSHHSLAAWTARMEITESPDNEGRAGRAMKQPKAPMRNDGIDVRDHLDWGDGQLDSPVPVPIPLKKQTTTPFNSWANGPRIYDPDGRCRLCLVKHGMLGLPVPCPGAASFSKGPVS